MQLKCIVCSTIPQLTGQLPYLPITFSRRSFLKIFGILCYLHKCAARKNVKLAYKRSVAFLQKLSLWFTMLPYVHEFVCVFWVAWFVFMFMCVLFYLGQLSHFLSCFGAGVTNLNDSPLLRVRSWLHPFKGHCEQQAMRDEWVIHVAGHPLLNRRCTRLPGCIRLRNDLYCVEWGVKLYSLTHSFHVLALA